MQLIGYSFFWFALCISCGNPEKLPITDSRFYLKLVNPQKDHIQMYWKDHDGIGIHTFDQLNKKLLIENKKLVYAINGGMYLKDRSPQGLYIENGKIVKERDTVQKAYGNFYLQPNGVFGLTKSGDAIISTSKNIDVSVLNFATQSGPMLLINGDLHPAL